MAIALLNLLVATIAGFATCLLALITAVHLGSRITTMLLRR